MRNSGLKDKSELNNALHKLLRRVQREIVEPGMNNNNNNIPLLSIILSFYLYLLQYNGENVYLSFSSSIFVYTGVELANKNDNNPLSPSTAISECPVESTLNNEENNKNTNNNNNNSNSNSSNTHPLSKAKVGLYMPICTANSAHIRVVNILPHESYTLSTRDRVSNPMLIYLYI